MKLARTQRWITAAALCLAVAACGGGQGAGNEPTAGAPAPGAPSPAPAPAPAPSLSGTFATHQRAANWVGQTEETGELGDTTGSTFLTPRGIAAGADGKIYISDQTNGRVLVFDGVPSVNGATASFAIGAPDLNSVGNLNGPSGLSIRDGKLALALTFNQQVAIYNTVPQAAGATPDLLLGQAATPGCSATRFNNPVTPFLSPDGKFIVADRANHRVLVWDTVPTTADKAPDMVLGQGSLALCRANDDAQVGMSGALPTARTLNGPNGVWTDGTRLVIADTNNSRVLIWNTFPTLSFEPADIVLGQENFTSSGGSASATGLNLPNHIAWNGRYLAVSDALNNRVLLWDGFPTMNAAPAQIALGQPDMATSAETARDAFSLTFPSYITFVGNTLFVTELSHRVSIFKAAP